MTHVDALIRALAAQHANLDLASPASARPLVDPHPSK
jgi:hypothetical protein